jgi:hypothetical protein
MLFLLGAVAFGTRCCDISLVAIEDRNFDADFHRQIPSPRSIRNSRRWTISCDHLRNLHFRQLRPAMFQIPSDRYLFHSGFTHRRANGFRTTSRLAHKEHHKPNHTAMWQRGFLDLMSMGTNKMVGLGGVEPPTCGLGNRRSIHLSYSPTTSVYHHNSAPRHSPLRIVCCRRVCVPAPTANQSLW